MTQFTQTKMKSEPKSRFSAMMIRFFKSDKIGLLVALLVIILVFQALTGGKYLSQANMINIMIAMAVVGLVTIGESFLLITGKVDLSPGSVAAFSGVFAAILLNYGLSMYLVIPIVILIGMGIGALNALLVNKLKLEAFIATLATMSVFRGMAYIICGGKAIFLTDKGFLTFGAGRLAGIPIPVIIFIIIFGIFMVVLSRTRFGRNVYMIGGNPVASRLTGINSEKMLLKLFMMTSALAALGGCIMSARMSSGQPMSSEGLEFDAVTAAVLGGVAMSGGIGSLSGALIGLFIMQGFNNGLMMLNVPSFWQTVSRGLLLIAALSFDFVRNRRSKLK